MDKNSPEWKKYKQDQADFKNTYQAELDKKHNIGTYTNTRNPRNPPAGWDKKGQKQLKLRTEKYGTPDQIKYDKTRATNDLGNKLLEVEFNEGFEYDKRGNRTKSRIKGMGRRIYPNEGRHGEGGQTSIENPEFHGEKRTGLFGQEQKPSKETAISEEKPLEELTDGELSEVEKLMYKKMALGRTEGDKRTGKTDEDYEKPITQMNLKEPPVYRKGKQTGTPIWDQGVKRPRTIEEVQAPEGNVKTSNEGNMQMDGSLGRKGNAPPVDSPHWKKDLLPIATNTNQENQTEQERATSTISDPNSADALEAKFIRQEADAFQKGRAKRDAERKAKRQKYEKKKGGKETEVECPHCSGKGRMAMSMGYGGGMGTCRNCGGKGKGTEFHYTDTEGNMKKAWESWLEKQEERDEEDYFQLIRDKRLDPHLRQQGMKDEERWLLGDKRIPKSRVGTVIGNNSDLGHSLSDNTSLSTIDQKIAERWKSWLEKKKDQGQGDARYGNPHETGMEDPRKLQTTKDDFSMEEKKMLKMHKNNGKPYIQIA